MIRALALTSLLLVAAAPQEEPPPPPPKSRKPPCCDEKGPKPWPGYNKGVQWVQTLETAAKKAQEDNRLLMVFQLVGDLDKEGC